MAKFVARNEVSLYQESFFLGGGGGLLIYKKFVHYTEDFAK